MKKGKDIDNEPIKYGLQSIYTVKYNYVFPSKKINPQENADIVNYNITPLISFIPDQELIMVRIIIQAILKELNEQLMEIETAFSFKIKDFKEHIIETKEEGLKTFKFKNEKNEDLFKLLISISYSTMRGVVLEKNKGTFLDGVYLPIVDPNIFFKSSFLNKQNVK